MWNDVYDVEQGDGFSLPRIQGIDNAHWLAVRSFLQRAYFELMWIFQEIIAAREIVVVCGPHELNWEDISNLSLAFKIPTSSPMSRMVRAAKTVARLANPLFRR